MTKACQFLVPSKHPCCKATGRESCKVVRFQCCVQKLMLRCSCFQAKTPGTSATIQPYFGARWWLFLALNPNGTVVSKHGPALLTERSWTVRCAQWVGDVLCELGTNVAIMKLRVKSGIILQIVSRESPPPFQMVFLVFSENVYQKDPESTWHVSGGHMFVFWSEEFAAFMLHGRRFLKAFKFLDSAKLLYEGHFDDSHFSAFHHKTSQLSRFDLITNYIMNHSDVYSVRIYIYIYI